jgi:chromosome partitioning protein
MITSPPSARHGTIIVAANEKGGPGKTFFTVTAATTFAYLLKMRILIVDLDPQGHAGHSVGILRKRVKNTVFDVLRDPDTCPIQSVIQPTSVDTRSNSFFDPSEVQVPDQYSTRGPDVIPINESAIQALSDLKERMLWSLALRDALVPIRYLYDGIFIDTNPLLGAFIGLGLCAADYAVIPVIPEELPTQGVVGLAKLVREAQQPQLNPGLKIAGIFFNLLEGWSTHERYMDSLRQELTTRRLQYPCFRTGLKRSAYIARASELHSVVTLKYPFSDTAKAVWALLHELALKTGGPAVQRIPQYIERLRQEEAKQRRNALTGIATASPTHDVAERRNEQ